MIVRISKRDAPYAMVDKKLLEDERLTWKAKGLLAYLLGKPDNWKPIVDELVLASKDGAEAVRAGLKELEGCGYLIKTQARTESGKINGWEYAIYEVPQTGKPDTGKPDTGKPYTENPALINKDINNKDLNKNELNKCANDEFAPVEIAKAGAQCDEGDQPGNTGRGETYSADFLQFWELYPRKKEKSRAWRTWKTRLKEKISVGDMIRAAEHYAKQCQGKDEQYIKLAATFLGPDKPYADYIEWQEVKRPFAKPIQAASSRLSMIESVKRRMANGGC